MPKSRFTVRHILAVIVMVLLAVTAWRLWRGVELPGYMAQRTALVQVVVASGRVVSPSRSQIGSEVAGVVLERSVQEGDRVQPGEILLRLHNDAAQAQLDQAETALEQLQSIARPQAEVAFARSESQLNQAERESQRRRSLLARSLLSREALEQAEQAEVLARNALESARLTLLALAPGGCDETLLMERVAEARVELAKTVIRAERAGTVLTRHAEPGDLIKAGQVLLTLASSDDSELLVPLDEKNLAALAVGQNAQAVADAYPDKPFAARISLIAPRIDPQSGTVEVHLMVDAVPDFLREDMTVSVTIQTGQRDSSLALPNDALVVVQGNDAQVLLLRDGRVERRPVKLGLRGLAHSEILSGLNPGDQVLSNGSQDLADGTRVRLKLQPWPGTNPGAKRAGTADVLESIR